MDCFFLEIAHFNIRYWLCHFDLNIYGLCRISDHETCLMGNLDSSTLARIFLISSNFFPKTGAPNSMWLYWLMSAIVCMTPTFPTEPSVKRASGWKEPALERLVWWMVYCPLFPCHTLQQDRPVHDLEWNLHQQPSYLLLAHKASDPMLAIT